VVPDWGALRTRHGIEGDPDALVGDPRVRDIVQTRVDALNRELTGFESVRAFALLAHPFSEVNGELTPTLKPKRRVIARRYRDVIDAMYEAARLAHAREGG
jgi:long-chain acyl-CoA synthetase